MNNTVVKKTSPGGKRTILGEALPLNTPYVIQIFPVYGCNFRCEYCLFALPKNKHGYISNAVFMDFNMYKKCIDDIKLFNGKLKMLRFAGIGEPLLHKDIAGMIKYAKENNVAQSIDIVTNAALLDKELSLALIDAGLDRLRISIQGVTADKYKEISGIDIDFAEFLENIRFFYKNRGQTRVYIKIIDCAISNKNEEQLFYDIFESMCDSIAIEHLVPAVEGIDYNILSKGKELELTQSGNPLINVSICPQPFYAMHINPDGNIIPCCSLEYPCILGDANAETLPEIWNGKRFNKFRSALLDGVKNAGEVCSKCSLYMYGLFEEDMLDNYAERLKNSYL